METATVETPREATEAATGSSTIADLFPLAVRKHGPKRAVTYRDEATGERVSKTYEEVGEIVRALSLGLIDLGIEKGDKVAILANTRPEWSYFDFAALSAGATVVPIYQTNSPEECQYVLENSDALAVIVEDEAQLEKIREVRASLPELEHVIRMTGRSDDAISMDELVEQGASRDDEEWEQRWSSVTPEDICTFIYTSGTTGPPKGCVISHGNYRSMLDMVHRVNVLGEDEEQLDKIRQVRDRCPKLEHVIRMTGTGGGALSVSELVERGAALTKSDWAARYESVASEDICTFIYTSGTTGPPKGCVISHGNYRAMLDMVVEKNVLGGGDELTYLFLPLAHSFALLIQFGTFELGATLAYWERDPLRILPNLTEVKPTYFPSVPRIFEKIYTAATASVAKEGGLKKAVFEWAIGVGKRVRRLEREGRTAGPLLALQHRIADRQVLAKIRALFGGNLKLAVTGAAPINPEILEFFDAAGVLVLEGWGMTETSTASTVATPE
ncbi:MAG: AMP-binding protein, partial [Actinomycetota bacterium]